MPEVMHSYLAQLLHSLVPRPSLHLCLHTVNDDVGMALERGYVSVELGSYAACERPQMVAIEEELQSYSKCIKAKRPL